MKRIPNKTAIATICYGISGLQNIAIYDYENEYDLINLKDGKLVYKGKLNDGRYDYRLSKYFDSEYHGMRIEDGTIVFDVYTRFEAYKF